MKQSEITEMALLQRARRELADTLRQADETLEHSRQVLAESKWLSAPERTVDDIIARHERREAK